MDHEITRSEAPQKLDDAELRVRTPTEAEELRRYLHDRGRNLVGQAETPQPIDNRVGYARRADVLIREVARAYNIDPGDHKEDSQYALDLVLQVLGIRDVKTLRDDGAEEQDIWHNFVCGDDGMYYGTVRQIASTYELSDSVIRRKISETETPSLTHGERTLYRYEGPLVDEIERYVALEKSPRTVGVKALEGVGVRNPGAESVYAITNQFDITPNALYKIIAELGIDSVSSRGGSNKENELYEVTDELIRAIEAWKTMPAVDEHGFVEGADGWYGLPRALEAATGWSKSHIMKKIQHGKIVVRTLVVRTLGRGDGAAPGREALAYHIEDVIGQLGNKSSDR